MTKPADTPARIKIYGSNISYYTGKLEAYLKFRGLAYDVLPTIGNRKKLIAQTGVVQMPVMQFTDGQWMTDTTPIIAWLEKQQEAPSIYPKADGLNFLALLIEDYADEWLWRVAMHYRWSYRRDRAYAAETLYTELVKGILPLPRPLALVLLKRRQRGGFVRGDGVTAKTRAHVESGYVTALKSMQAIFEQRPFLLGDTPTIADFGLMAPMFRHFGQDPTPSALMRAHAPAVFDWMGRMWNVKASGQAPKLINKIDAPLTAFLAEICETHLAQLRQNADAFTQGKKRYRQIIQGCNYANVPMSRYRVWCLEILRAHWRALPAATQKQLRAHLPASEAAILWEETEHAPSQYDVENLAPFNRAINVFGTGVPPR